MGLNSEVRNFFTNRINTVLYKKLEEVRKQVDKEAVANECVARYTAKYDRIGSSLPERIRLIQTMRDDLEEREKELSKDFLAMCRKENPHFNYYSTITPEALKSKAMDTFRAEVVDEWYPEIAKEETKINRIKEDVQGAVLLATTETKLVKSLTKVLENCGGDISELLALIPPTDE